VRSEEKMAVNEKKNSAPMEKRIQELLDQCRGIPPAAVMQLLMRGEHNAGLDVEQELEKLFEKYKPVNSEK
jgi:hypothetical protein